MATKKTKTTSRCVIAPANFCGNVDAPRFFCIKITKQFTEQVKLVSKFLKDNGLNEARRSCNLDYSNFNDIAGFTKKEITTLEKGHPIISAMEFDEILDCEPGSDIDNVQVAFYLDGTFSIVMNVDGGGEIFSESATPDMK